MIPLGEVAAIDRHLLAFLPLEAPRSVQAEGDESGFVPSSCACSRNSDRDVRGGPTSHRSAVHVPDAAHLFRFTLKGTREDGASRIRDDDIPYAEPRRGSRHGLLTDSVWPRALDFG